MRTSIWRSGVVWASLALALGSSLPARSESEADKARAIAERFATGKDAKALPTGARRVVPAPQPEPAEEQRLSEEIDMLARARAEAEVRREELVKASEAADRAEQAANRVGSAEKAAEQKRTADERQRAEDALRAAETKRMAEEARQAAETQRRADEERQVVEERRKAAEARQAAETQRRADEERQVVEQRLKAEEREQAAMEAEREAEAERIAEALRKAREARMPRDQPDRRSITSASRDLIDERPEMSSKDEPQDRDRGREHSLSTTSGATDPSNDRGRSEGAVRATRVAVLMVLTPGNYGIRRHNKTADPLLCGEQGCYVSAGAALPAELMRKRRALGVSRTLGPRAGACQNSLGCIFRGVDLVAYPAIVQPVDMHVIKHDRRQPQVLHETSDCRLSGDRLSCSAIKGPDYTLWVVPEDLAERAGPAALERALENGLDEIAPSGLPPGRR